MVALIQNLRKKHPSLWRLIESMNSSLISLRMHNRFADIIIEIESFEAPTGCRFRKVKNKDIDQCFHFLATFDEVDLLYFHPFPFSIATLQKVISEHNYLLFAAERNDRIVGLFFYRLFFTGRAFLGFSVAKTERGHGLGTAMIRALAKGAKKGNLDLYSTVSRQNI